MRHRQSTLWRSVWAALWIVTPSLAAAQTPPPTFLPAQSYPVNGQPTFFVVADFNGDGIPDLVSGIDNGLATIALGDGKGGFGAPVFIHGTANGACPVVGDFNRDGKKDLALCSTSPFATTSLVLLGNGDGTFQAPITVPVGLSADNLVIADFNGDAIPDLAAAGEVPNPGGVDTGGISLMIGHGDGTFTAPIIYAAGSNPLGLAAGDFNRDGRMDLAVAGDAASGTVAIFLGNADGTFTAGASYGGGDMDGPVVAGDFNGDGIVDLVTAGSPLQFWPGRGDGTFGPPVGTLAADLTNLVAVDMNGDGRLDLAGSSETTAEYEILTGKGDGTFQVALTTPTQQAFDALAVADLDGDGLPDLVLANDDEDAALVELNSTQPANSLWTEIAPNSRAQVNSVTKLGGCDGCYDGGAVSKEIFESGDASVTFTAGAASPLRVVGLASTFTPYNVTTIDFGLILQAGDLEVAERGVYRTDVPFVATDQLQIAAHNGVVTYSKNGVVFYTSLVAPTYPFSVAVILANLGASVTNVVISTQGSGGGGGGTGSGGGGGGSWSDTNNLATTSDGAQKTTGCDGCFDAWGVFGPPLTGDGFVEFTIGDATPLVEAGLANTFVNGDPSSLDFAFKIEAGWAEVREQGVYQADIQCSAGDVFRISMTAGVVSYSHNGVVYYTSTATPQFPLSFAALFASLGGSISNVTVSGGS